MRDYRALLATSKCWDMSTQAIYDKHQIPLEDCIMQNREELIALCEWMETEDIRSYLEIGIWTGRLIAKLHELFQFDTVAACDPLWPKLYGLRVRVRKGTLMHVGDSTAEEFTEFRKSLGHIDLVMIDGDHSYEGVKRDFEINRTFPHRFLAFHDISGHSKGTEGVRRFWEELEGNKIEFCLPHRELNLDHTTMGIGIWSESSRPAPGASADAPPSLDDRS